MGTVKCVDCGLLALLSSAAGEVPDSTATREFRQTGGHSLADYHPEPHCYVKAHPIDAEFKSDKDTDRVRTFLRVINNPRSCGKFHPWDGISTPKEVNDMLGMVEMAKINAQSRKEDLDRADAKARVDMDRADAKTKVDLDRTTAEAKEVRDWQTAENEKSRKLQRDQNWNENARWVGTGFAIAIFSVCAFFGGQYFEKSEPRAKDAVVVPTTPTQPSVK